MNEEPKSKGGRPKAKVDPDLVEKLAGIGCPNQEIAAIVGCSVDTLDRRFAEVIRKGRENGKTRLRKKQIEVALAGNVSMLIFLGKNMLGQSDKVESVTEVNATVKTAEITPKLEEEIQRIAARQAGLIPPAKMQ